MREKSRRLPVRIETLSARPLEQLSQETGLRHVAPLPGERVEGVYRRSAMVGDQRYAVIEKAREFSLVPWRPVLERAVGKPVSGVMRDGPINWTIGGRSRAMDIG